MRLEERIVLDGAAAVVVEQAAQAMADAHIVDNTADANGAQDSHTDQATKDTAQADSGPTEATDTPDVAALLKAVAPQENQSVSVAAPAKDTTSPTAPKDNSQPEEDPVTVLVASSGLADVNDLLGAAKENVVTVTYDGDSDNPDDIFNKIESALDGKQAASIGFASHSIGSGSLHLGGDYSVDADTLLSNPEMTEFWKNVGSLVESDGHIDLLGCGVADGELGKDFIAKLEQITGREIAASIDDTGNAEAGGNWLLEEGGVDLAELYFDSGKLGEFDGVLATPSVTIELASGGASQTLYDVDGDGYYEIDTAEKLIALSQTKNKDTDWDRNYELTGDVDFAPDHTAVDWDGDGIIGDADDAKGFTSIGRITFAVTGGGISVVGYKFSGNFDGNGHKVSNLYINRTDSETGLFGWVAGASLSDIKVVGADIRGGYRAGALAGYIQQTTITNCSATGSVSGGDAVGGLIGYTFLANTISSSSAVCDVSGESYVGGLVGSMDSSGHTTVSDSFAEGTVTSTNTHAGGLVGSMGATGSARIENSHAKSTVTGASHVGGLVGSMEAKDKESSIYNSYAEGQVTGSGAFIGGLVGLINGDKSSSISQSHATGKVIATGGGASMAVGGLLGGTSMRSATSSIQNCYASGYVSAAGASAVGGFIGSLSNSVVSSSYSSGNVSGTAWVGGLVGNLASQAVVENSYATGNVTGTRHSTGGLVGKMGSNDESGDCSISTSYASGVVTGIDYVGGLVGGIDDSADTMNITNSYAIGNVKGNDGVGGLVGSFTGVGLGKISKSSALGSRVEGVNFTGRVIGRNWGTLEDNRANLIMETEGWTVKAEDKGANTKDGADYAAYPYHVYRTWDTAVWDFPVEKSDNVTLKNAGAKAVAPGVNHAPTITSSTGTMTAINENTTSYDGQTVSSLINPVSSDSDSDTLGVAITFAFNDHGEWQYNNGAGWKAIGTRSSAASLLLAATDKIRFIPNSDWTGDASINFRAWDGTNSKSSGSIVDTSANGGSSAFSADESTSKLTVKEASAVNHAPTVSAESTMTAILENTTDPAGQKVATLIPTLSGDADGDTLGIAVTSADNDHGEWQYRENSSSEWKVMGRRTDAGARTLKADDWVRFIPNADWAGTTSIGFRVWDGTDGADTGHIVDATTNGGSTAYSAGLTSSTLTVKEAPVVEEPNQPPVEKPNSPQDMDDIVADILPDQGNHVGHESGESASPNSNEQGSGVSGEHNSNSQQDSGSSISNENVSVPLGNEHSKKINELKSQLGEINNADKYGVLIDNPDFKYIFADSIAEVLTKEGVSTTEAESLASEFVGHKLFRTSDSLYEVLGTDSKHTLDDLLAGSGTEKYIGARIKTMLLSQLRDNSKSAQRNLAIKIKDLIESGHDIPVWLAKLVGDYADEKYVPKLSQAANAITAKNDKDVANVIAYTNKSLKNTLNFLLKGNPLSALAENVVSFTTENVNQDVADNLDLKSFCKDITDASEALVAGDYATFANKAQKFVIKVSNILEERGILEGAHAATLRGYLGAHSIAGQFTDNHFTNKGALSEAKDSVDAYKSIQDRVKSCNGYTELKTVVDGLVERAELEAHVRNVEAFTNTLEIVLDTFKLPSSVSSLISFGIDSYKQIDSIGTSKQLLHSDVAEGALNDVTAEMTRDDNLYAQRREAVVVSFYNSL